MLKFQHGSGVSLKKAWGPGVEITKKCKNAKMSIFKGFCYKISLFKHKLSYFSLKYVQNMHKYRSIVFTHQKIHTNYISYAYSIHISIFAYTYSYIYTYIYTYSYTLLYISSHIFSSFIYSYSYTLTYILILFIFLLLYLYIIYRRRDRRI